MEYPQQAWLAFMTSILAAYILGGWRITKWQTLGVPLNGYGNVTRDGSYSYMENKKPLNLGDARAG